MKPEKILKISVVGNAGGGKTTLSRQLAEIHHLPLIHMDSIQFSADLKIKPLNEIKNEILNITAQDQWIIDGFGPFDLIEKRFEQADRVVFIDLPLKIHQWWFIKRQMKSLFKSRTELPPGAREATWAHTKKVLKTMKSIDKQMRPELIKIFNRDYLKDKVIHVQTVSDLKQLMQKGLI